MKFDIARQPLVPAFLTLAALAVVAMWNAGGPAVSMAVQAGHAAGTVDIGRNARPAHLRSLPPGNCWRSSQARTSRLGALDRRTADALHGHVRRAPHRTLQPLLRRNLSRHPALRSDRLRPRRRRRLPDDLRRIGPAGPRHEEFLPFVLQRIRLRRHLPRLALHRTAAAHRHGRSAAPDPAAAGRHAFPAHAARSRRRGCGPAAARSHALLRQLGPPEASFSLRSRNREAHSSPERRCRCSSRRPCRTSSCREPSSSST